MTKTKYRHLQHPTDNVRSRNDLFMMRSACNRPRVNFISPSNWPVCPKCAAAVLIHEVAIAHPLEA